MYFSKVICREKLKILFKTFQVERNLKVLLFLCLVAFLALTVSNVEAGPAPDAEADPWYGGWGGYGRGYGGWGGYGGYGRRYGGWGWGR